VARWEPKVVEDFKFADLGTVPVDAALDALRRAKTAGATIEFTIPTALDYGVAAMHSIGGYGSTEVVGPANPISRRRLRISIRLGGKSGPTSHILWTCREFLRNRAE
jgi:hypothetical protein